MVLQVSLNVMVVIYSLKPRTLKALNKICKANIGTRNSSLSLAYKIHGPSPPPQSIPIFVLHGFLGEKRNWQSFSKRLHLATKGPIIAVDARNHGESPHHNNHSYFDLAGDVLQLINNFGVKKVHIIGHSMGGRTGMMVALTQPSKVASLIVVDISPVSTTITLTDFFPKLIPVMKSVNFEGAENINKARNIARDHIIQSGVVEHNLEGLQFLLMNIDKLSDKNTYGWKCNLDALLNNFQNIASFPDMGGKQYNGPTLFIGGGLSSYIPRDDEAGIKKYFPTAEIYYIDGVGHNVHAENPNKFFETVMKFFSRLTY